jgi:hypothetical protein
MNSFIYKIKDTDDDTYSEYIQTDKEAKAIIENAVENWISYPDDEYINANNVYECIEKFLTIHEIQFEWIYFNDANIIEY